MEGNTETTNGADLTSPFAVCKAISDVVGSTLGPKGLYKMVVRSSGTPVVSKDSETILDEMDIEHPAYDIIRSYISDNSSVYTTLELVLLGELIENALELIDEGIHPTLIVDAYDMAAREATASMASVSTDRPKDRRSLEELIATHLESKTIFDDSSSLSNTVLDALCGGPEDEKIDVDDVEIYTVSRKQVTDSVTVPGICVKKRRPVNHTRVSLPLGDVSVLLTSDSLQLNESSHDIERNVRNGSGFTKGEANKKDEFVRMLAATGCDVVFSGSRDNADHEIQQRLSERGIAVFHQIDTDVMQNLARVTGATDVLHLQDVSETDLGHGERIRKKGIGDETYAFVENDERSPTKTILLQAGTEQVLDTYETALEECLHVVDGFLEDGKVIPGGGASELHASIALRELANGIGDRKQLAVRAYADALESIPGTLAVNAGMDPVDTLVELRNKHDAGNPGFGVNGVDSDVADMYSNGCVEPLSPKISSVRLATETAILLLRIDGILLTDDGESSTDTDSVSPESAAQHSIQPESATQD
jgi:chaperonin GroEL (HSP60 family)